MYVYQRVREYGDRAIRLRNDCGAVQPVCSRNLLLGWWSATGDVRHRLGPRRQLLSCWHDNRNGHNLSCGQLLRRRGRKRWCVGVAHENLSACLARGHLARGLSLTTFSRSRVHVHVRLRKYVDGSIVLRNDCGAMQCVHCRKCMHGQWCTARFVRKKIRFIVVAF